jgi:hypothetical protein
MFILIRLVDSLELLIAKAAGVWQAFGWGPAMIALGMRQGDWIGWVHDVLGPNCLCRGDGRSACGGGDGEWGGEAERGIYDRG